jgi:hypothetical protein
MQTQQKPLMKSESGGKNRAAGKEKHGNRLRLYVIPYNTKN